MTVFSAAGGLLIFASGGNARPIDLGTAFLLIASSFALRPLLILASAVPSSVAAQVALSLSVDAYLPYFLWRFFSDFPRGVTRWWVRRVERLAVAACAAVGTGLFLSNVMLAIRHKPSLVLSSLAARDPTSQYWTIVYGLCLPAIPFALWKTATAQIEERRRLFLLLATLLVAAVPISVYILLFSLSASFASWAQTPQVHALVMPVLQILTLSVPVTTTYAVLVERMLDIRLLLRVALQHGVARGLVVAAAAMPFAWAAWYLYTRRAETLVGMVTGLQAVPFFGAAALGLAALRLRRRAVETIDRTFFREQYDARQILVDLARQSRDANGPNELSDLLIREIDRAMHLESIVVLIADQGRADLWVPHDRGRVLSAASEICAVLTNAAEPVVVELEKTGTPFDHVAVADREWLADVGARLLVPLLSSVNTLVGIIVLGMKRSELPFSREDRQLLSLIAASGGLTIETRGLFVTPYLDGGSSPSASETTGANMPARECSACQTVQSSASTVCANCKGELFAAAIPYILLGKFRLERRLGQGGMGIVYRGIDLGLHRIVALKTLPKTSPEDSIRLRREARAMAAVVHPNLAMIYGVESWKGTPVLIVEYLDGGTLADRLRRGPLSPSELLELGRALAQAIERIHGAGILHRDVKPSNIGYAGSGVPKLLDFGLARIVSDAVKELPPKGGRGDLEHAPASLQNTTGVVGTPLYMSPQALRCEPPDASFDLWGVGVVLFEALTGRHPFQRATWFETFDAITQATLPDPREWAPGCPEKLQAFFHMALDRDPRRRPATAAELWHGLADSVAV
jgi:hypothetical protein